MAEALGADVTLVTGVPDDYDRRQLAGLRVVPVAAMSCPRYENTYLPSGEREQRLYDDGAPLDGVDWASLGRPDIVIVAPAFHEFSHPPKLDSRVRGISLQGALRERLADDRIRARRDAISAARQIARAGDLAFLSDEDTAQPDRLARALARTGVTVVVTHAERGASLHHGSQVHLFPAYSATVVEPTGAGDCFATAFTVRFHESGSLEEAMRFALVAGSLAVEGEGVAGIPNRAAIERRFAQVAA
jgi:1D-myo-inositol 3-kinase